MFTIAFETPPPTIRARLWGFLTVEEVADFSRQEQQMLADRGYGSGEFLLLIETEGSVTQSQEVTAALTDLVANSPLKARRIAVVHTGILTRMQTQRILMIRDNAAIFETLAEAEAWLFQG